MAILCHPADTNFQSEDGAVTLRMNDFRIADNLIKSLANKMRAQNMRRTAKSQPNPACAHFRAIIIIIILLSSSKLAT